MRIRPLAIIFGSVLGVSGLALTAPSTALASYVGGACSSNNFHASPVADAAPVHVYAGTTPNGSGRTGTADAAAGVCIDDTAVPGTAGTAGGDFEVGANTTSHGVNYVTCPTAANGCGPGVYAILDGSDNNYCPGGFCNGKGYAGISNYETGAAQEGQGSTPCSTCSSNSGGAIGVDQNRATINGPFPIACGNTSGNDWDSTNRDGCFV
jgi:hypothetical protein